MVRGITHGASRKGSASRQFRRSSQAVKQALLKASQHALEADRGALQAQGLLGGASATRAASAGGATRGGAVGAWRAIFVGGDVETRRLARAAAGCPSWVAGCAAGARAGGGVTTTTATGRGRPRSRKRPTDEGPGKSAQDRQARLRSWSAQQEARATPAHLG